MWYRDKKWRRFVRYSLVGGATFLFDISLLIFAVSYLNISYVVATPTAFLVAVSLNYVLSRKYVFHGSARRMHTGYFRFIVVAIGGALFTTALVAGLVAEIGVNYLIARIVAACCIGVLNYLFNLHINFKVVGYHKEKKPVPQDIAI